MLLPCLLLAAVPAALQASADEQYQLVVALYEKGLHSQVVKECSAFLERYPAHPKADLARYRLASSFWELNQKEQAAPHYRSLAEKPSFEFAAECAYRLGAIELESGRSAEALSALQKVLELDKEYLKTPARFLCGEALLHAGRIEEAEGYYTAVLEAEPRGQFAKDATYGLAWCAFRQGHHDVAVQRARGFLQAWPKDPARDEIQFLLGESWLELGKPKEALASYQAACAPEVLARYWTPATVAGAPPAAAVNPAVAADVRAPVRDKDLLLEHPFFDAALRGTGFAHAALGDSKAAAAAFTLLYAELPSSRFATEAALQAGIHHLRAGQVENALAALTAKVAGDGAELLYWRAEALERAGRKEEALVALEQALAREPAAELAARIHGARGDVLYELGRLEDASRAYEQSGSDYALHAAAVASLNAGRHAEAARHAASLLERYPESRFRAQAHLTLGEALLAQKKYGEAETSFQAAAAAAAALEPADDALAARCLSRMGWCRFLLNDPAAAAQRFAALVASYPDAPEAEEARFMAGRAQEQAGARDGAAAAYAAYLDKHGSGSYAAEALLRLARLEPGETGGGRLVELLERHPDSPLLPQALYELAERFSGAKNYAQAEPRYRELLERFPQHELAPSARYGLGWCLYETGRHAEAVAALRELAAAPALRDELRVSGLELLIWAAHKAADAESAVWGYQRLAAACQDEERRLRAAQTTVLVLKGAGRVQEADKLLTGLGEGARSASTRTRVLVERTYLALERKDVEGAERLLRQAGGLAPQDPAVAEAFFFVGEARYAAGQDEAAAALYAAAAAPGSPVADRALYKQGFAHMRRQDYPAAAAAFEALTEDHPASELHGEGLFLLGEARFRAGRFAEAVEPLARLREQAPQHESMPKALFRLGLAHGQLQSWKECQEVLGDLARRYPKFENLLEAELWRGKALAALGDARGARQALDRVLAGDQPVLAARAHLEIGRMHLAAGATEDALREFLLVYAVYGHEEEVSEGLYYAGQCLERMGDPAQARKQYQEILDKFPRTAHAALARARLQNLGS